MDYDRRNLQEDLEWLNANWARLPRRIREGVMMITGGRELPKVKNLESVWSRQHGDWFVSALNEVKNSEGYLSDNEIAKRIGVAASTLSRSERYQHAKKVYLQQIRKVVRRGGRKRQPKSE